LPVVCGEAYLISAFFYKSSGSIASHAAV